jgi:LmbE family N-acetylglucosaminyl deacetylase
VVRLVRQVRPALVYLPHEHDGSFDHQAAYQLTVRALEMAGSRNFARRGGPRWVPAVLGDEVWSARARTCESAPAHAMRSAACPLR